MALAAWKLEKSKDNENNFPNKLQPNEPTKFRRPERDSGEMLIRRYRSVVAFLHNQDPKPTSRVVTLRVRKPQVEDDQVGLLA
jgi:hypothetical protein